MKRQFARRSIASAVIVLGLSVAAPGLRSASAQAIQCPGASCDVAVTVSGSPPKPVASDIRMKKGTPNPVITWKLNAPDYVFRSDSIKAHTGAPVGGKSTTSQAAWDAQITFLNSNDTQYRVKNKNGPSPTLYYDITVYHRTTGAAHTLDPAIINDP